MIDPPHLIPRALAFRLAAHVLWGEGDRREKRADPRSHDRPGRPAAVSFARDAEANRRERAAELYRGASLLRGCVADARLAGPGIDPAVFAHLLAWLTGRADSWTEMAAEAREWLSRELLPARAGDMKYAGDWPLAAFVCRLVICADDGARPSSDIEIGD